MTGELVAKVFLTVLCILAIAIAVTCGVTAAWQDTHGPFSNEGWAVWPPTVLVLTLLVLILCGLIVGIWRFEP